MSNYTKYTYNGPVMKFDKYLADSWHATTYAASEKKARINLEYQFKRANNMCATSSITLPGQIKEALINGRV